MRHGLHQSIRWSAFPRLALLSLDSVAASHAITPRSTPDPSCPARSLDRSVVNLGQQQRFIQCLDGHDVPSSENPSSDGMKAARWPINQILHQLVRRSTATAQQKQSRVTRVSIQETLSVPCRSKNTAHVKSRAGEASRSVSTSSPNSVS